MAHKKGVGSSKNGRESESKRLGIKLFGGQFAKAGNIIVRQRGTVHNPGENVGIRKDKLEEFNRTYKNSQESLQQAEHYEEIERDMFMNAGNYRNLTLFLHQYSGFVYRDYTDLLYDKKEAKSVPTGTCLPFSKKMFVTVNSKILPCERIGHQFALGMFSWLTPVA